MYILHIHVCMCECIHIYVCVYIYMCVYYLEQFDDTARTLGLRDSIRRLVLTVCACACIYIYICMCM